MVLWNIAVSLQEGVIDPHPAVRVGNVGLCVHDVPPAQGEGIPGPSGRTVVPHSRHYGGRLESASRGGQGMRGGPTAGGCPRFVVRFEGDGGDDPGVLSEGVSMALNRSRTISGDDGLRSRGRFSRQGDRG